MYVGMYVCRAFACLHLRACMLHACALALALDAGVTQSGTIVLSSPPLQTEFCGNPCGRGFCTNLRRTSRRVSMRRGSVAAATTLPQRAVPAIPELRPRWHEQRLSFRLARHCLHRQKGKPSCIGVSRKSAHGCFYRWKQRLPAVHGHLRRKNWPRKCRVRRRKCHEQRFSFRLARKCRVRRGKCHEQRSIRSAGHLTTKSQKS